MKKSLIALLVVLALVITVSAFSVSADETAPASADYTLTITDGVATAACPCEEHKGATATFTAWTGLPSAAGGHWYLTDDYTQASGQMALRASVIHLNGHKLIRGTKGAAIGLHAGKHYILDNPANEGGIHNQLDSGASAWAGTGGLFQVANSGTTLNIYGGTYTYTESTVKLTGALIGVSNKANVVNIYGGNFYGNSVVSGALGGAIGVTAGTVNVYGGTISGHSPRGGAIYAAGADSHIVIDGGTITGSTATDRGGSVCTISGASFEMKSGLIENGYCWGNQMGGNIYAEGNVTVSGGTITGGNTTGTANTPSVKGASGTIYGAGRGGNICIRGAVILTMTGGTISNGVSPTGGNLSIEGTNTNHSFSGGTISGGEAFLGGNITIHANAPGGTFSGTNVENGIVYVTGSSNGRGGNLYNTTGTFNITGGTFTGGTIKGATGTNTGMGANVYTQKSMTITNATLTGGAATTSFGGNLAINSGVTVTLGQGGIITNGTALRATGATANGQGGNVMINNGTLDIQGGTVSNTTGANNANHAGNIYLPNANATLKMSSGTISGGNAISFGGNIYAFTNSTVNVTGGTISGGKAGQGANLYIRATTNVTLKDCNITGGTSSASIWVNDAAAGATLNGATVSGATAGAIRNTGALILTNATISGNTGATAPGVYNLAGATVTMTGGSISGNTATTSSYTAVARGGNVYNSGTFNLVSGTIENGIVQNSYKCATGEAQAVLAMGGNIYNDGTFTMTTGTISGGKAQRSGTGTNLCQGGNVYNAGTFTMADGTITGGKATTNGGNLIVIGTADKAATFTMEKGTISEGYSAGNQGGVRVSDYGTFTMNDGLIDNNDAVWSGGNIAVQGTSAVLDINGGTISNGDSTSGSTGNILVSTGGTATIDNATISGGTAKTTGGNLTIEGTGTATVTNTTITGGHSIGIGGNVNITVAGSTFTGCEITNGVAGTKNTDTETGDMIAPTTDGRGGNVATNANTTFTNCVFRNGESYGTANPGGGNVYIYSGTNQILDGCTITGGFAYKTGGNIVLHGTPTVYIKGDSYIAGGEAYTGWGGNIGYTNAAKLHLQGNTEVDGKDAYCASGYHYGNNVGMSNANANVSHELHVEENAVIKNGDHVGKGETFNRYSVVVAPATSTATPKIYLSGNGSIDKIFLRGNSAVGVDNIVVLKAGYTGSAQVYTNYGAYNNTVVPGADVYDAVTMDGYTGTGSLKVLNGGQTGYITFVDNGVLKVAGITGFKGYNLGTDDEYTVETGFATLDAVVDAGYDYAKLYAGGTYTLSAKTDNFPIDLNNQIVTFNTGSYKLYPIDYRTDGRVTAKYTQLTVDTDENVVLQTRNPINGYQYLNVKGTHMVDEINAVDQGDKAQGEETEKTFWTSNRVQVELTKVSIKTAKDGIYYTTKIGTNANAAPKLIDYGTAVSLVDDVVIDENFLDNLDTNGVMFTAFELEKTGNFSIEARSALVSGILSEGATDPNNDTRAKYDITATSFVTAMVGGTEVKIMADETHVLSFEDIMIKLDEKVEELNRLQPEGFEKTIATAVAFYTKWADPFASWTNLPNLKAEAAKVA